jgi:hypothetical protein
MSLSRAGIQNDASMWDPAEALQRREGDTSSMSDAERAVVHFGTVQLFVAIYLQKFAIGPLSFQINVPILIMFGHIAIMLFTGRMSFSPLRLSCFLLFAASCLFSQVIAGTTFSVPSLVELLLIYSFFTVTTTLSQAGYERIMKRFIAMMIIPAFIVLVQYWYQKITGGSDPISMTPLFPKTVLLQGYFYEAHYPWNAPFQRPNGFFFLEPSVVSMFTASAAIIELTLFRRAKYAVLMVAATAFSMGGTGMTMLTIAAPFLLARQPLSVILLVVMAGVIAAIVLLALDVPLPFISRATELQQTASSGGSRILIPAQQFIRLLTNPYHLLAGNGAGSTTADFGNAWPIVKLLNEYGMLTVIAYVTLYLLAIVRPYNAPLAIALSFMFHFTGGYLLDGTIVQFIAVIYCMLVPVPTGAQQYGNGVHRGAPNWLAVS